MRFPRPEGTIGLERNYEGRFQCVGAQSRGFERQFIGRSPLDAIHLSQQISADSGVTHALAAVTAWEAAAAVEVAHNGLKLRELLHLLSFLHAHLQQFYFQILPDYLPLSAFSGYAGKEGRVLQMAQSIAQKSGLAWAQSPFTHRFSNGERDLLLEHVVAASRVLSLIQRALALVGGKFPVVMSIVPGGMSTPLNNDLLIRLSALLQNIEPFLSETAVEDGLLCIEKYPLIRQQGQGIAQFRSAGGIEPMPHQSTGLFVGGNVLGNRLLPMDLAVTESISKAFYRIARSDEGAGTVTMEAPAKSGAYSWIKAPRIGGLAAEVGPVARLVVAHLAGSHSRVAGPTALLEDHLEVPVDRSNTIGGRMLALLAEMGTVAYRCREILGELIPEEATAAAVDGIWEESGQGKSELEAPSGTLKHSMTLEAGKITHYDIIAPSTWNGSSADADGNFGSLETALSGLEETGEPAAARLFLSRLLHSFAFSGSDAVH